MLMFTLFQINAQMGINKDGTAPHQSAMLDIKASSTTNAKGLLMPRVADHTVITSPATGLMVFNTTTNTFWYFNGLAWTDMGNGGSSGAWLQNGTNVYTNNNNVGINTATPQTTFDVKGDGFVISQKTKLTTEDPNLHVYNMPLSNITYNDAAGILYDPSGPTAPYPSGTINTTTTIFTPDPNVVGIKLTFEVFDTETNGDSIIVMNSSGTTIVKYSGNILPPDFFYNGSQLQIKFKTNGNSTVGQGFKIRWQRIDKDGVSVPISGIVGNNAYFDTSKGAFRSGFMDPSTTPQNTGNYSVAMGYANIASGYTSVAMGRTNNASGIGSIAMGTQAKATGSGSLAFGNSVNSTNANSIAMGNGTTASGTNAIVLGAFSYATANSSTSIGFNNGAYADYSTALGSSSVAYGYGATAIGNGTNASGYISTAIGYGSTATSNSYYGTAMGYYTTASSTASFASGYQTISGGYASTSMGNNTNASAYVSTALGNGTNASGYTATAMGNGTIASGFASTALGNSTNASGYYTTAMGSSTKASGDYSTAMGNYTLASGYTSTSMGSSTKASGDYSTAMGIYSIASSTASFASGYQTTSIGYASTSMGNVTNASGYASTSMGNNTNASGNYSTAIGVGTVASGFVSTAMGFITTASGSYSTAMGCNTTTSGGYSTAMGNNVNASNEGSFVIGDSPNSSSLLYSQGSNSFSSRFRNGYYLYTSATLGTGAVLFGGGNSWSSISDSTKKENFLPISGENVLKKIANMRTVTWNYKGQDPKSFRHYGPMAQEFFSAFGRDKLGVIGNDTTIASADFDGINFTAVKALEKRTSELQTENELLKKRLAILEKSSSEIMVLKAKMEQLEAFLLPEKEKIRAKIASNK